MHTDTHTASSLLVPLRLAEWLIVYCPSRCLSIALSLALSLSRSLALSLSLSLPDSTFPFIHRSWMWWWWHNCWTGASESLGPLNFLTTRSLECIFPFLVFLRQWDESGCPWLTHSCKALRKELNRSVLGVKVCSETLMTRQGSSKS